MAKKRRKSQPAPQVGKDGTIRIPLSSALDYLRHSSQVAQDAARRGNAAGTHGSDKYGTAERRQNKLDERNARLEGGEDND